MDAGSSERIPAQKAQFPCAQCGAQLSFAPGTKALRCAYCGHENVIEVDAHPIEELDFRSALAQAADSREQVTSIGVRCDQCAAETTLPPNITSASCPYCGANLVLQPKESKRFRAESLLPFKIPRAKAFEDFQSWIRKLWFAPGDLRRFARSEDKLTGMYIPYWTFDSDTTSSYRGERGDDYFVTESYTANEGGRSVTRTRQVRKTRWTPASGVVRNSFDDILVLASRSLPKNYADRLEPWDLENLVPYSEEFLSGFRAESYQVGLEEGFDRARELIDEAVRRSIQEDIGGDHQRIHSVDTRYGKITFKHLLLPIWLSAYRYRNKVYRFLVNARTGEVQGGRPWSVWKITGLVLALLIVIGAVILLAAAGH